MPRIKTRTCLGLLLLILADRPCRLVAAPLFTYPLDAHRSGSGNPNGSPGYSWSIGGLNKTSVSSPQDPAQPAPANVVRAHAIGTDEGMQGSPAVEASAVGISAPDR